MTPSDRWTTHRTRTVWPRSDAAHAAEGAPTGPRVEVHDVTAPEGDRFDYPVVHLPRVAVALVVRADRVLALRTYRYPVGRYGYELPGGGIDTAEEAGTAAARECAEETGWRPVGPGRPLIAFEPLPGGVATTVHVHLWHDAVPTAEPLDRHEPGRATWLALDDVPRLAAGGELLGSGTLVALLQYTAEHRG